MEATRWHLIPRLAPYKNVSIALQNARLALQNASLVL